jgi:hypothetical protein
MPSTRAGLTIFPAQFYPLSWELFLFSLGSELDTIKMLAEVVWKDDHLNEDRVYYPHGAKFVNVSSEDEAKLRNFLRSLSSPMDDPLCPFNTLKARFWTRGL